LRFTLEIISTVSVALLFRIIVIFLNS